MSAVTTRYRMFRSIESQQKMLIWMFAGLVLCSWNDLHVLGDSLPSCQPGDFHYEYTECDSNGGRWRVSVPQPGVCTGGAPNAPVRGKSCDFVCEAGQYMKVDGDQECYPCPPGFYSLGGGVRLEDFETLPKGFSTELKRWEISDFLGDDEFGSSSSNVNCTGTSWNVKNGVIQTDVDDCSAILKYTVNLVRPGTISFKYQCEDESLIFTFEAKNSKCSMESFGDDFENVQVMESSYSGKSETFTYDLTAGVNDLYWSVTRLNSHFASKPNMGTLKGAAIQSIDITGVAFTSECTACKAGTYSSSGASSCTTCPINTYSNKGASICEACDLDTSYSEPGAPACTIRLPCTVNDYYQYNSPCDAQNQTRKLYKWFEPRICRTDHYDAAPLPIPGPTEPCPPCNPGMENVNGVCHFCSSNQYSDGTLPCAACPPSTAPQNGIVYKWWTDNLWNSEFNLTTACIPKKGS